MEERERDAEMGVVGEEEREGERCKVEERKERLRWAWLGNEVSEAR